MFCFCILSALFQSSQNRFFGKKQLSCVFRNWSFFGENLKWYQHINNIVWHLDACILPVLTHLKCYQIHVNINCHIHRISLNCTHRLEILSIVATRKKDKKTLGRNISVLTPHFTGTQQLAEQELWDLSVLHHILIGYIQRGYLIIIVSIKFYEVENSYSGVTNNSIDRITFALEWKSSWESKALRQSFVKETKNICNCEMKSWSYLASLSWTNCKTEQGWQFRITFHFELGKRGSMPFNWLWTFPFHRV